MDSTAFHKISDAGTRPAVCDYGQLCNLHQVRESTLVVMLAVRQGRGNSTQLNVDGQIRRRITVCRTSRTLHTVDH
jgi:hypothetical protein